MVIYFPLKTTKFQYIQMMRKLTNWLGDDQTAFNRISYIVGTEGECSKISDTLGQFLSTVQNSKIFSKDEVTMLRHFMERLAPIILDKHGAVVSTFL